MKEFNINKELEFVNGIMFLKKKYGNDFLARYWKPQFYKNGFPVIKNPKNKMEKEMQTIGRYLDYPREHNENEKIQYNQTIDNLIQKYNFKINGSDMERSAIYRYYVIGALNNISLSVSPKIKRLWKINFELFGAFYNTNYNYCGLFSDIENSCCDFNTFVLRDNMVILINPHTQKNG